MERFSEVGMLDLFSLPALTLATTGPDGEPHAAAVYFVAREVAINGAAAGLRLYFFSDPLSQHGQDLHHDGRAAAAIFPLASGWQDIRGLQLRGLAEMVDAGAAWEAAWAAYAEKFPFVVGLRAEVARSALYAFIPSWFRLVDNQRGFGYKEEWTIP
jgi:uncharacterized protein YhbP (UPF0306 family)